MIDEQTREAHRLYMREWRLKRRPRDKRVCVILPPEIREWLQKKGSSGIMRRYLACRGIPIPRKTLWNWRAGRVRISGGLKARADIADVVSAWKALNAYRGRQA